MTTDADGTSQRESFRRYLTLTVQPCAALLEWELTEKLEAPISLGFDSLYAHDLAGRAMVVKALSAAGVPVAEALAQAGLVE